MTLFVLNAHNKARANVLANLIAFLQQISDDVTREVEIRSPEYTPKQRRSIFGPAYKAMMEFAGLQGEEDKRELHYFWCREFFGSKRDAFGREIPIRTTTRDENGKRNPIDTKTAAEFYEFLQRKGAEVGCHVPDPEPTYKRGR